MRCGRRDDMFSMFGDPDAVDDWEQRDGYPRCSHCGSLSPDALFEAIAEGVELDPTDKSYKIYVHLPAKDPDALHVVASATFKPEGERYQRVADLPQSLYQRVVEEGYGSRPETTWVQLATSRSVYAKFYFQHFDEDQKKTFIEMMNERTLNIGYPGYFYRLPFFCQRISKDK